MQWSQHGLELDPIDVKQFAKASSSRSLPIPKNEAFFGAPGGHPTAKKKRGLCFSLIYNGQFGKWYRNNELDAKLGFNFYETSKRAATEGIIL